jgi:hypothetical protein
MFKAQIEPGRVKCSHVNIAQYQVLPDRAKCNPIRNKMLPLSFSEKVFDYQYLLQAYEMKNYFVL